MPAIPQLYQTLTQTVLEKVPTAFETGKETMDYAKPGLATAYEAGKHVSTTAFAHARPYIQNFIQSGKKVWATLLEKLGSKLPSLDEIRNMPEATLLRAKLIAIPALRDVKQVLSEWMPLVLAFFAGIGEIICQHPVIAGLGTGYALLSLMLGPLWPLSVLLKIAGFGAKGVALGSRAAVAQARIGNVVARSLFATLQSLGATIGI